MIRVLILEHNEERLHKLSVFLENNSYFVCRVESVSDALNVLEAQNIGIILANSNCGGMELSYELRSAGNDIPVLVLTDDTSKREKRRIFRSGADGYMFFPLDFEELCMRIRNLLWRCKIVEDSSLRFGNCSLKSATLSVETPQGEIFLRKTEFLLLQKLVSYPGRIFTRSQLLDDVWGFDSQSDPRTVDTHIKRLRKELKNVDDILIQTVRGVGYRAALPRKIRKAEDKRIREDIL